MFRFCDIPLGLRQANNSGERLAMQAYPVTLSTIFIVYTGAKKSTQYHVDYRAVGSVKSKH